MATRIHLTPGGHPAETAPVRRLNFNRSLVVGAAVAMWAAILVVLKLLPI